MKTLKQLLVEIKLYGLSTKEVLYQFLRFEGKTLILLDTEASGLQPNNIYEQLTQLSALAVDGSTWKVIDQFDEKASPTDSTNRLLNDPSSPESKEYEKDNARWTKKYKRGYQHPRDTMRMTHYDQGTTISDRNDEKTVLTNFESFLQKHSNVILVAHNATFDLKVIASRRRINGLPPLRGYKVLDTLKLSRYFFIPTLQALESNEWAKKMLEQLLAKTKYKSYSANLSKLGQVFGVKVEGWHDALEDTKILLQVMSKIIEMLERHPNVDIRPYQGKQAKRFRNFTVA